MHITEKIEQLTHILASLERVTVAVSGGVDSMTLAYLAHQTLGNKATMAHAVSPAVPRNDTQRIENYTQELGWNLRLVQTGEIALREYRENPVNRCYYCKNCLYTTLNALKTGQVISGTNVDDLGDFRPGLIAAQEHHVRHPYVEADIDKKTLRAIATHLGLKQLADLPASPCLASRVETGIIIQPPQLEVINQIENLVRQQVMTDNIRCRITARQLVIQIDQPALTTLAEAQISNMQTAIIDTAKHAGLMLPVIFAPYQRGSAFIKDN
jgi:uncharacterized protein